MTYGFAAALLSKSGAARDRVGGSRWPRPFAPRISKMPHAEPSQILPIETSMNEASRWRLAMARAIAPVYTTDPRVRTVIVAGSVARGFADAFSDVEIGLFWEELPTPGELRAAMERARGTDWELDPYDPHEDVWYEEYVAGGLKIDLRHMAVARMEEALAAVVDEGDLSRSERQQILFAVQHSVPLHGALSIETWRAKAARYPDRLAHAMVDQHVAFPPWWSVSMYAERGDLPMRRPFSCA
jgi:predicted nucleotidyltransferase